MALATPALKATLELKIKQALDQPFDEKSNSEEVKQRLARNLAAAIADGVDTWIKTAIVNVQPGIAVSTPVGPGVTTSPGVGTIS